MRLTWHLIKKDLRRFWPMSLFLVVLVAFETWCGARLLGHEGELDRELFSRVNGYAAILVNLQTLVIVLFTAALIQEDSLVGSSGYWMTRPISNRRLLVAKGGALVLLAGLLPALAAMPWWVYAGFSPGECARGLLAMLGTNGTLVLFASPFALVTPNLGRFLLTIFLGLLGFAGVTMAAAAWGWQRNLPPAVAESRAYIAGALIVAFTLAVIVIQLRPRRTPLASNVLALGFLVATVAVVAWPWELPRPSKIGAPEDPATQPITLRATDAHLQSRPAVRVPIYRLDFDVIDVPRDHFVTGETLVGQRLVWPDMESEVRVTGRFLSSPVVPQAGVLLGLESAQSEPRYTARLSHSLVIHARIVERFHERPSDFEMKGRFHLQVPSLRGEVPFERGAVIVGDSSRTRILETADETAQRTVTVIESRPSSIRSRQFIGSILMSIGEYAPASIYFRAHHYYLVNRQRGRLIEAAPYPGGGRPIRYCTIAFVEIFWRDLVFPTHRETSGPDDAFGASEDLTFASLAAKEIATFERDLVFPSSMFPLPPPAETHGR